MTSKLVFVFALLFGLIGYAFYIPLPPNMAEPWTIRWYAAVSHVTGIAAALGALVGRGTIMGNARELIDWWHKPLAPYYGPDRVQREDTVFNGIPVRIYRPQVLSAKPRGAMVFYHGGGWISMSVESHDSIAAYFAVEANIVVISVEYRLAPEYSFPDPFLDCLKATKFFLLNADKFKVDPKRVALAGDSGGGNFAAGLAIKLRDENFQPMPRAQVLIYPMLQFFDFNLPSAVNREKYGKVLESTAGMVVAPYLGVPVEYAPVIAQNKHISSRLRKEYQKLLDIADLPKDFIPPDYTPTNMEDGNETVSGLMAEKVLDPSVSPLMARDLSRLPEAFIFTVEFDFVRDDGVLFYKRLLAAGVKAEWVHYADSFHGCSLIMEGVFGKTTGTKANAEIVKFLRKILE